MCWLAKWYFELCLVASILILELWLLLWDFFSISYMYVRCLIKVLKGENQSLEKLGLNLIWYCLRNDRKLGGIMITLSS